MTSIDELAGLELELLRVRAAAQHARRVAHDTAMRGLAVRLRRAPHATDARAVHRYVTQTRWRAAHRQTLAERRRSARLRFCDDCGQTWRQGDGRLCPSCGRLGGVEAA